MSGMTKPLSDRTCDAIVCVFAAWTVLCHGCVAFDATLHELVAAATAATIIAILTALAVCFLRQGRTSQPAPEPISCDAESGSAQERTWRVLLLSILLTILAIGFFHAGRSKISWAFMVVNFAFLAAMRLRGRHSLQPIAVDLRRHEAVVWGMAVLCSLFALYAHRPNIDDCFYVNASVGVVDHPDQALLKWDTMHGIPDTPLLVPVYRLHSVELLTAVASWLTGVEAIDVAHLVIPAIGAIFCCLAWARLLRILLPVGWIWAFAAVVFLLMFVAGRMLDGSVSFALLRLQQGKSLLVTACIPLMIVYVFEYLRRPSARTWIMLAAAQIAALGFSSTAIWLAPTVVGLTALSLAKGPVSTWWKTMTPVAAASVYVLAAGLAIAVAMQDQFLLPDVRQAPVNAMLSSFRRVFGDGLLLDLRLAVLLLAWYFCPNVASERLCILYPLGALLTVLNPYLANLLATTVIGGPTYWRVLWALPMPMFIAIVLASPKTGRWGSPLWFLPPDRRRALKLTGYAAVTCLLLALAVWCVMLTVRTGTIFHWPGRKVDAYYAVAAKVVHWAPPGSRVLAPAEVSTWIPTFHRHPYPMITRDIYAFLLDVKKPGESNRCLALTAYVGGTSRADNAAQLFAESLRGDNLQVVCFQRSSKWADEIQTALEVARFTQADRESQYEVWVIGSKKR